MSLEDRMRAERVYVVQIPHEKHVRLFADKAEAVIAMAGSPAWKRSAAWQGEEIDGLTAMDRHGFSPTDIWTKDAWAKVGG